LEITAFDLAQRFVGVKEGPGSINNPQVVAMLRLDQAWPAGDDVAWCSAFVNYIAWLLRLPRSKSLGARSWLTVGVPVMLSVAKPGDVVVLKRGEDPQPGPNVVDAPGHVGFFAGLDRDPLSNQPSHLLVLGGNQRDQVCIERFPVSQILGIRRLATVS
jgi:uncharacterized protein (TIGR02594 family)